MALLLFDFAVHYPIEFFKKEGLDYDQSKMANMVKTSTTKGILRCHLLIQRLLATTYPAKDVAEHRNIPVINGHTTNQGRKESMRLYLNYRT